MAGSTFTHTDTGGGALAHSVTLDKDGQLREVRIHLDIVSATEEDITVTIESFIGTLFDALLVTHDMNGVADLVLTFNPPVLLYVGDTIATAWANSDNRNWGYQFIIDGR